MHDDSKEPVAWLHQCRKKPELATVTMNKREPALAAKGYRPIPLYAAPQASEAVRDAVHRLRNDLMGIEEDVKHGGYAAFDHTCLKTLQRVIEGLAALSAQPGAQKHSPWRLLADAIEKLGPDVPDAYADQWLQISGSIRFGTNAVTLRNLSLVPHPKQHNDGGDK